MLILPGELLARLRAHLEAAYPREGCGILIGDAAREPGGARTARDLALVPNAWPAEPEGAGPRGRFLISPDDVTRASREAARRGLGIVGFFHSHPDRPARPSGRDREHALPGLSHVIVSVRLGRAEEAASWVLRDDLSGFDPEGIAAPEP